MELVKKQYIDFNKTDIEGNEIKLVIKEGNRSAEFLRKKETVSKTVSLIFVYLVLTFLAIIVILPFYWMLITSLKLNSEVIQIEQTYFPTVVMWSNYVYVFQVFDFGNYLLNTIVVAVISTLGTLITTILAAFAFAKLEFKGKNAIFAICLMTMMIPGEMMVISNFITVNSFGWVSENQTRWDAYLAMIVPFWVSVYYIYLLRENFKQIPNELYLAAKVDGKSDFGYLLRVLVPLAAPTLISISILKFIGTWNSYVWPNTVVNNSEFRLISNGLRSSTFTNPDTQITDYGYQMAAATLVTVPLILLFIFFRKYIMRGVGRAGIKG